MIFIFVMSVVIGASVAIHAIEAASLYARVVGAAMGTAVTGYAVQIGLQVFTRFFMLAVMPLLGILVDYGIDSVEYLVMVQVSLALSAACCFLVLSLGSRLSRIFRVVLTEMASGAVFYRALGVGFRQRIDGPLRLNGRPIVVAVRSRNVRTELLASVLVYGLYGSSVFVVFFVAGCFREQRAAITQLSGVLNGFATILLTVYLEPWMARRVDRRKGYRLGAYVLGVGRALGLLAGFIAASVILLTLVYLEY
jgi:Alternate to MurJ